MAIAGAARLSSGQIHFDGRRIDGLKPEKIARLGFSLVREGRHVFSTLTVEENLRVGMGMRGRRRSGNNELNRILDYFPILAERRSSPAGRLSGGEQQMLVIGRALLTKPRLIAIDEPSLGLAPLTIDLVYALLTELRRQEGTTLLLVEQSAERALGIADRIYVMRSGRVELSGSRDDLADRRRFEEAYFGLSDGAASISVN